MKTEKDFSRLQKQFQIWFLRKLQKIDLPEDFYMLFLAALIGIAAGFGTYALNKFVDFVHHLSFDRALSLFDSNWGHYVWLALIPGIGGLAVGLIIRWFAKESKGHGVPSVIEAIANRGGFIRPRVSLLTVITAGTTIGTGGSAGKEGPIVQIGAAIGSTVGQVFNVSSERLKVLVGAGAGAGLAAVFNAPVTGVLFALEVILADFSINAFTPIMFATVISTAISHSLLGGHPLLEAPVYYLESFYEYPIYVLMGIVGGVVAVFFTRFLYASEDLFNKWRQVPEFVKPALGGLLLGIIALKFPEMYGFDDSAIQNAIMNRPEIWMLFSLMLLKILATTLTLGSGGSGGLFTPSLFIGATFGAFFGTLMNTLFPGLVASPGAYALVGMGIMIAGTTHATISALLLIFEITHNYQIILPLMLGTIVATLTARLIMRENIYTMKIALSGEYIFKGRNMTLLQSIPITRHIQKDFTALSEDTPFTKVLQLIKESNYSSFPVLDKNKRLVGVVRMRDIRPYMFDRHLYPLLITKDIAEQDYITVHPDQSLADVLRTFDLTDAEFLPVTERRDPGKLLGVIYRDQLMRWYRKAPLLQSEVEQQ
ncbi:MAG: chloride channel protein [Calditrichia bacterium]